ncbi:hypothetical protein [Methylophaga sulfidovorans]|uniref:VPLPA-CTERM protein sorting domain-containing protein n=1 Tax=Methylophaga sulfidovorans TaxID=45496 RepID=A0A1I4BZX0_9GAMM|nr:hypothetical protein [Methylophaga sulfidovorans]SFK73717.1 hypothetical protein SAMN04488079_12232 [Methylophaga sulfidovorans]
MKYIMFGLLSILTFSVHASTMTYSNQATFQSALDSSAIIDTSAYIGETTDTIDNDFSDAEFFGPLSNVRSDDYILNGEGFFGASTPHVGLNFAGGINGIGITSNPIDGGVIKIFDGLNGTGTLLGVVAFGGQASSLFGGIISTNSIRSAIFTCDYNSDLECGLRDPVYGSLQQPPSAVPVPAAAFLFTPALLGMVGFRRKVKTQ